RQTQRAAGGRGALVCVSPPLWGRIALRRLDQPPGRAAVEARARPWRPIHPRAGAAGAGLLRARARPRSGAAPRAGAEAAAARAQARALRAAALSPQPAAPRRRFLTLPPGAGRCGGSMRRDLVL